MFHRAPSDDGCCHVVPDCEDWVGFDLDASFVLFLVRSHFSWTYIGGELDLQGVNTSCNPEGVECRSSNEEVEGEGYVDNLETNPHNMYLRSSAETHREVYLAYRTGLVSTNSSDTISKSLQLLKSVAEFL